jgi:hypothetical protein
MFINHKLARDSPDHRATLAVVPQNPMTEGIAYRSHMGPDVLNYSHHTAILPSGGGFFSSIGNFLGNAVGKIGSFVKNIFGPSSSAPSSFLSNSSFNGTHRLTEREEESFRPGEGLKRYNYYYH